MYKPDDKALRIRDGILEILPFPECQKFVMDVSEGWLAYVSLTDQLFIKTFEVYTDRVYGDIAGNNASIWYNNGMCEIEPMGPLEIIPAGQEASFTEHWHLFDYKYPGDKDVNLSEVESYIDKCR
jgi:hypothetical protein